ncbi:hypothetical protein EDB19DRAFT_1909430 [Suillus lakei]|nr:hypothetical protein EDB19DRAFT_1909430 [Suillus lakei]
MSSPGASPRDLAPGLRLVSMSSPSCTPPEFVSSPLVSSPHVSSPLKPPLSPRLRQAPLQSPVGGIPSRMRRPSFSQSHVNVIPPNPILGVDVARRTIEGSSFQTSPRQRAPEQSTMSSPRSPSGHWLPSLAASPILEAPPPRGSARSPYPSHKRSSSYHFPATGGGSSGCLRSSSSVHNPSTPDHRNSYSFSHTQSPRSPSSVFVSPATSMHDHSLPPSSFTPLTPPRRVPFQARGLFVDRDCDEVDSTTNVKGDVPGRPPRRWWNLTVPWNADEWWTPGDFVYQDEPRLKYDERLYPIRPKRLNLPTSDTPSDEAVGELTVRPMCVGIAEEERDRRYKNMFAPFRREGDHKSNALSHFTGAERDGFNRAQTVSPSPSPSRSIPSLTELRSSSFWRAIQ